MPDKNMKPTCDVKSVETSSKPTASKSDSSGDIKYKVTITTGKSLGAGTDADVQVKISGAVDSTDFIILDKANVKSKSKNDLFERKSVDIFEFIAADVGIVHKIDIKIEGKGLLEAWEIESLSFECKNGKESWTINKWMDQSKNTHNLELKSKNVKDKKNGDSNYNLSIKTADDMAAGTDSKVTVQIIGSKTSTGEILLNEINCTEKSKNLFEKGNLDQFVLKDVDVGKLKKVKINSDGKKLGSSWKIEYVKLDSSNHSETWTINKWLDDEELSIELVPKRKELDRMTGNRAANSSLLSSSENDYNHVELRRLKDSLTDKSSRIRFPRRRDYHPFVFNDLNPYYNTKDVDNLIKAPANTSPIGYHNRFTAMSIVEPWVAHRMESAMTPSLSKSFSYNLNSSKSNNEQNLYKTTLNRSKIENREIVGKGSTLAPNFPKIKVQKPKDLKGPFTFADVNEIRKELKRTLTNQNRFNEDRNRTISDYFRMQLDQTAEKEKMIEAYHAYLENTPGSKKALEDLLNNNKKFKLVMVPLNDENTNGLTEENLDNGKKDVVETK